MPFSLRRSGAILAACCLIVVSASAQNKLLEMADKLDALDKADLQNELDSAERCISDRDFACVEKHIAKAAKLAVDGKDRAAVALTRKHLADEQEEVRRERERRLAEERRREAEEERERQEEERRARAEQEARMADADSDSSTSAAAVFLNGLAQTRRDMAGAAGILQGTVDRVKQINESRERERQAQLERDRIAAREAAAERDRERAQARRDAQRREDERQRREEERQRLARQQEREAEIARQQERNRDGLKLVAAPTAPSSPDPSPGAAATTKQPAHVDSYEARWQAILKQPKKTVKRIDAVNTAPTEAEARRAAAEHFALVRKNYEQEYASHSFYERIVRVDGITCRPSLGPKGEAYEWTCGQNFLTEIPDGPNTGATLDK